VDVNAGRQGKKRAGLPASSMDLEAGTQNLVFARFETTGDRPNHATQQDVVLSNSIIRPRWLMPRRRSQLTATPELETGRALSIKRTASAKTYPAGVTILDSNPP
jgi:hypothetical protein